jgi:hypothetical protein
MALLRAEIFEVYLGVLASSKSAEEDGLMLGNGCLFWSEEVIEEIKRPCCSRVFVWVG